MALLEIKTSYATYTDCALTVGHYQMDNSIAVEIYSRREGPVARLTVCLCDPTLAENEAYVDANNCPWALDFIREYELGKESGYMKRSGYCNYPAVVFDMEQLKRYEKEM